MSGVFLCCDPPCPIAINDRESRDGLGFQITQGTASPATSTVNSIWIRSFAKCVVLITWGVWFIGVLCHELHGFGLIMMICAERVVHQPRRHDRSYKHYTSDRCQIRHDLAAAKRRRAACACS